MKLVFQLFSLWAFCSPAFCAVFEPETQKGTKKEPVSKATVDADAGVSFAKDSQSEKSAPNAPAGMTVVKDIEKIAESEDVDEEDAEEDEEGEEEETQDIMSEIVTCKITADETIGKVTYNYLDLTSTVAPLDYVSQWSVPKTFTFSLVYTGGQAGGNPPPFLSIIASTNNPNIQCAAFAVYCTAKNSSNHEVAFPLLNDINMWRTTPLFTTPPCISSQYGLTGECVGDGNNWDFASAQSCPTSDASRSAFGITSASWSNSVQMGAAAPFGAFRWPPPFSETRPSESSLYSRLTSPLITCDIMPMGGSLVAASYLPPGSVIGNASFPGMRTIGSANGNLVYRVSFLAQPGYYLTFVHRATGNADNCGLQSHNNVETQTVYLAINCQGVTLFKGDWDWYATSNVTDSVMMGQPPGLGQNGFQTTSNNFCNQASPPSSYFPPVGGGGSMGGMYPNLSPAPSPAYVAFRLFTAA